MVKQLAKLLLLFGLLIDFELASGQQEHCQKADVLMKKQDYTGAIGLYEKCLGSDSTRHETLNSLAFCYLNAGDYALAKEKYHILERVDSFGTEAAIRLASIYEVQQNLPKAIRYNLLLSKRFPGNPVYLRKLGSLYLQGRESTQSRQMYREALMINPRDLLAVQGLSEILVTADSLETADSLLSVGLKTDSLHIGLSLLRSRVLYRTRHYRETADILHRMTYRTELNNYYNKLLGYSFMQIDSLEKAIFHLQKSLLEESDPEYALFYLALAYEKKKEYERSDWYYSEAIKAGISENVAQYYRGKARIAMQTDKNKEAIDLYRQSLEYQKDPTVYFFMANAADLYYKDKTRAAEYYRKYLASGHDNAEFISISKERLAAIKENRFMKGGK